MKGHQEQTLTVRVCRYRSLSARAASDCQPVPLSLSYETEAPHGYGSIEADLLMPPDPNDPTKPLWPTTPGRRSNNRRALGTENRF
jgi:hypothetical protein